MAVATQVLSPAAAPAPADGTGMVAPGELVAARGPEGRPVDGFLLLRDHVRGTFAFNRTSLAGHAIGAVIVEIIFADVAPPGLRLAWGLTFVAVWLARVWPIWLLPAA